MVWLIFWGKYKTSSSDENKMATRKHCYNAQEDLDILLQSDNDGYDSLAGNTSSEDSWSDSDMENDEISSKVFLLYIFWHHFVSAAYDHGPYFHYFHVM